MPIFRIRASEQVFYKEDIEAETKEEAIEKFNDLRFGNLEPCDSDNFNVYKVEEYGND